MTDCSCTNFPASLGNVTFGASVGVGASIPVAPLDVDNASAPQVVVRGGATTSVRLFPTNGSISSVEAFATDDVTLASGYSRLRLTVDGTTAGLIADASGGPAAMPLAVQVGGSERLRITTTGNVGIGTPAPTAFVSIFQADAGGLYPLGLNSSNSTSVPNYLLWNRPGDNWTPAGIGQVYAGNYGGHLVFATHPNNGVLGSPGSLVERMRVDSEGNVGIGTSSPQQALDVAGTVRMTGALLGGDMLFSGALRDSSGNAHVDTGGCYYAN